MGVLQRQTACKNSGHATVLRAIQGWTTEKFDVKHSLPASIFWADGVVARNRNARLGKVCGLAQELRQLWFLLEEFSASGGLTSSAGQVAR